MEEMEQFLDDYFADSFCEFVGDIYKYLQDHNQNYKKLFEKEDQIKNDYPALRELFEENKIKKLKKKEVNQILQLVNIYQDKEIIQERTIFLKGMSFCFNLLKILNDFTKY